MSHVRILLAVIATAALAVGAAAEVVNVDIEAGEPNDTTHVGDDGGISTPGGMLWTSVTSATSGLDLLTEFGLPSPFDIIYVASPSPATYTDAGINNLQDSGDFGVFAIRDLVPGHVYELAVYCGYNGGFILHDDSGARPFFFTHPEADGWSLPGTEGNGGDYFHVTNVVPTELSAGVWGVAISPDGAITGVQISGYIPEPAAVALLALAPLFLRRRA